MSNIKLYPEDMLFIPGKGLEKELSEIIQEYVEVLKKRGSGNPFKLKAFSSYNAEFEHGFDEAYDHITAAANNGDIEAEKTLIKILNLLDYDFPNYFFVQENAEANVRYAKQGDIYSQGMLGDRYYYGKGVEKGYEKAVYWYKLSAEQGVKLAQYNLAGCYELGRGVEQSREKALEWYMKAAEKGVREAKRAVKRLELEKTLSKDDLLTYMPTYIWEGEEEKAWKDEFGVEYSEDGKRLLSAPKELKEYSIKKGTLVICDCAFYGCKIVSIQVPESVQVIGDAVFKECLSLNSILLPKSLREIGDFAFEYSGLTAIDIPENVTIIGNSALRECYKLESVRISKTVSAIGDGLFIWSKKLKSIVVEPENQFYDSRDSCNAIIEKRTNILVAGCKSTIIPSSISVIGDEAFWGCDNMTSIVIPDGVEEIGDKAFFRCEKLKEVVMGDSIKRIGSESFYECGKLNSVIFSKGLLTIEAHAFQECHELETANLPDGIKSIGYEAFWQCNKLSSLVIPDSVTCIQDSAFANCSGLKSLSISKSLKKIGNYVFCGCYGLPSIIIPDGVRIIGHNAFCNCTGLTSVVIPQSVQLIDEEAFKGCDGLNITFLCDSVEIISEDGDECDTMSSETYIKKFIKTYVKKE